MSKVTATETFVTESTLSVQQAFDRMVDLEQVPQWDKGIRDARLIHGTPGSIGARYELDLDDFDGKPTTAVYELTDIDGDSKLTMVGTHAEFRAEDTLHFEPSNGGCRVIYDAEIAVLGDTTRIKSSDHLAKIFAKVVEVVEAGVGSYLND